MPAAVEAAYALLGRAESNGSASRKKQLETFRIPDVDLTTESPVVKLALRTDLLAAIATYLRCPPVLTYAAVWRSSATESDLNNSQMFHCDFDDVTQIKVFVFCTNVEMVQGPLTVIRAADSEVLQKRIRYSFATEERYRVDDDRVQAVVDRSQWQPLTGPPGTMAMVDTSRCFHFGSRVMAGAGQRVMLVLQYLTPFAFCFPLFHQRQAPYFSLAGRLGELNDLQRFALCGT